MPDPRTSPSAVSRAIAPWAVLALGVAATSLAAALVARNARAIDEQRFGEIVDGVTTAIRERMDGYVGALRSARAFFVASDGVTREDFRTWVESAGIVERYPGIQGIGWAAFVPKERLPAHVAEVRALGRPEYRVWPEGERAWYSAIVYLEPADARNLRAFGYDMASEPTRREAMERARDLDAPAVSGRVVLVQEGEGPRLPGFLVYLPVYHPGAPHGDLLDRRAALLGWVYAAFRADDLFGALFPRDAAPDLVAFAIRDGAAPNGDLLYEHAALGADHPASRFVRDVPLTVAGRTWTLHFATRPEFEQGSRRTLPIWVFVGGSVTTLLAFVISAGQARRRLAAEEDARRSALLAEVGRDLGLTLDPESELRTVAERITETFADECRIALAGEGPVLDVASVPAIGEAPHVLDVPFFVRGEAIGRLVLRRRAQLPGFSAADRRLAADLARVASGALENARAHRATVEAVRLRDEFLSIASHELRTPLTALHLLVHAMLRRARVGTLDPTSAASTLERADRQIGRLSRLVGSLLEISRIVHGRLQLEREELDLAEVAREVVAQMGDESGNAPPIAVVADEPVRGLWDRLRIEQVLTNLASNAVKYGEGRPVEVRVERRGEKARITVRDRGIGISGDDLARIFDRFERAVSARQFGGLGLGLFIVRQIVEAHGGRIEVASEVGAGSTFTVELPSSPP